MVGPPRLAGAQVSLPCPDPREAQRRADPLHQARVQIGDHGHLRFLPAPAASRSRDVAGRRSRAVRQQGSNYAEPGQFTGGSAVKER